MKRNSLKLRLLLSAALGISISLLIAGTAFFFIFQRYAEQLATRELENDFIQLVSGIRIAQDDKIVSRAILSDPRFEKPYGGLYWQIDEQGQQPLRSRSLFDVDLPDPSRPDRKVELIAGPNGAPLFAIYRQVALPLGNGKERLLQITLAVERTDIDAAARGFRRDLGYGLAILSLALLMGSLAQILLGLRPLQALQSDVAAVHEGEARHVGGTYPDEVQPLVQTLNTLLEARDQALERARQRASNMAHGLKTPLTVLYAVADEIDGRGDAENARVIRDNTSMIHEQVERQLARARMASGQVSEQAPLHMVTRRLINTLSKTPEGQNLVWDNEVPTSATIAIERNDLTELLGNLMDNARKWAKGRVRVTYDGKVLRIEDDGPGVAADKLEEIEQRGLKLDLTHPGHGLGLSIVRDLVESYGLTIKYERSGLGGLSVSISKPA
ncbi:MAG: sensor histidine kinase [Alphaproteobacteria bacterium]|nr:sensor histidine kinase [Alphaproteobacteria bacterium]